MVTEREALIKVRDMLRRGELPHYRFGDIKLPKGNTFNMAYALEELECGAICCIAGWAAKFMGIADVRSYVYDNSDKSLYFPRGVGPLRYITPEQAAKAIDYYLDTGDPHWGLILKVHPSSLTPSVERFLP